MPKPKDPLAGLIKDSGLAGKLAKVSSEMGGGLVCVTGKGKDDEPQWAVAVCGPAFAKALAEFCASDDTKESPS